MLKKLRAGMEVMEAGKKVNNPAAWKKGQMGVNHVQTFIGAVLVALGVFTGMEIEIGEEELHGISTALVGIVPLVYGLLNHVLTVVTTNELGVQRKPKTDS